MTKKSSKTKKVTKATSKSKTKKEETTDIPENQVPEGLDKFVFMDKAIEGLETSFKTGHNIVLFGKGGHGKSEVALEFLREKGHEPFVMTMGSGTDTDSLFGGIDIKLFDEEGKIHYNVEHSFMNHEIVIFEELFDAPDFILEELKDILSSGKFRKGGQQFDIKTQLIICCTNKKREDFAHNDSLRALMERFPLQYEVKWDGYNAMTYEKLFNKRFGISNAKLCFILEQFAKASDAENISPRIALVAFDIMENCGEEHLTYIAEFSQNSKVLSSALKKFKSIDDMMNIKKELDGIKPKLKEMSEALDDGDTDSFDKDEFKDIKKQIKRYDTKMNGLVVTDEFVNKKSELAGEIRNIYDNLSNIDKALTNIGLLD